MHFIVTTGNVLYDMSPAPFLCANQYLDPLSTKAYPNGRRRYAKVTVILHLHLAQQAGCPTTICTAALARCDTATARHGDVAAWALVGSRYPLQYNLQHVGQDLPVDVGALGDSLTQQWTSLGIEWHVAHSLWCGRKFTFPRWAQSKMARSCGFLPRFY